MNTRYIIMAGGEGSRWENHTGVPKHIVDVNGERLLNRTVRLIRELEEDADIIVVAKEEDHDEYYVDGVELIVPEVSEDWKGMDKFTSSMKYWLDEGRTVLLYGDVYFSRDCMKQIVEYDNPDWTLFARPFKSSHTGCSWKECFAVSFTKSWEVVDMCINILNRFPQQQRAGGWELYYDKQGTWENQGIPSGYPDMVVIDDMTEDFDYPLDYDRWCDAYKKKLKLGEIKEDD